MTDLHALFAQLSREPDFDAAELEAFDATDELLLESASEWIASGHEALPGTVVTIGDRHGALTLGAAVRLGARGIRAHQDPLLGERALARNAERLGLSDTFTSHALDAPLLSGARLVLLQLPRGLSALDEIAQLVARYAHSEVTLLAGGRIKHMSHGMNAVLARSFGEVSAGLGWRKSRVLTARAPWPLAAEPGKRHASHQVAGTPVDARITGARRDETATRDDSHSFPTWGADPDLRFRVAAFGATFGGSALDHGSRLLLHTLRDEPPAAAHRIVDLGCGNGVLATAAALDFPQARVIATDQSAAAVAATRLTAGAAGLEARVAIHRADATEAVPDGWADLILLNPPFHAGATVHAGIAHRLIESSARALAPGGELRLVFNSHLRYRPLVERVIGPVRELARDRTFTVLSATRR
ncbi:class I SAM-dependent methyltransferase [Leucobacter sp. Z1108]|uniref:class I SAM-dependent methyltransferase n=1 Tax=unclassified Leucobacter TaxID=2621730 RepID=UPI003D967AD2